MRVTAIDTVRLDEFPNLLYVLVTTDDGLTGLGETYYGSRAVEAFLHETAATRVLGSDPNVMDVTTSRLTGYVGRGGSGAETRGVSAIDIALWDIRGKLQGQSLRHLVSREATDAIPVYNTCAGPHYVRAASHQTSANWGLEAARLGRYDDLNAALSDAGALAEDLLSQGIRAMKIWPFDRAAERTAGSSIDADDLASALRPIQQVRDTVRDRMAVKIEMHGLWRRPAADEILAALAPYEPDWVEDPIDVADLDGYQELVAASPVPIAMGETLAGIHAYQQVLRRRAANTLICDVGWCGGIGTAISVAQLAHQEGLPLSLHDCTGPVGLAVAAQLACALPAVSVQEFVRAFYAGWYASIAQGLPAFETGSLSCPDTPGHGASLADGLLSRPGVHITRSEL